ncbi:M23 family metallopeptidase [Roseomonas sp. BN140053]|uniref:M23 family metallopeptidase n=1 Tax=Roseomonas sp. BN140053 TaxID=3391898 RepID=UPI0039ED0652
MSGHKVLSKSMESHKALIAIPRLIFPLAFQPKWSYHEGMRRFGADRDHGNRKHAGCDLYAPAGTPIYACADGVILRYENFYHQTHALEVDHGGFIIRYGEVSPYGLPKGLKVGSRVSAGQQIAKVGHLVGLRGLKSDMIHFELYGGWGSGKLSAPQLPAFKRRADLLDPTPHLDLALMRAGQTTTPRTLLSLVGAPIPLPTALPAM